MGRTHVFWGIAGSCLLAGCIPANADIARKKSPQLEQPRLETLYDEAPVWEARPVEAAVLSVNADTYVVQPGDTLSAIGVKTKAGRDAIAKANGLTEPYVIKPGQILQIPGGRFHAVAQGESGIAIARAYNLAWRDIVALNKLEEPYILKVGQRLKLPEPDAAQAMPSIEVRAAAFKLDIEDIITGGEPAQIAERPSTLPSTAPTKPLPASVAVVAPKAFSGRFAWPVTGAIVARFGPSGAAERNDGIEISTPMGTPIKAAGDGVVAFVGDGVAGYGGLILIRHGGGWITAYGRAGEAAVTRGQSVKQGQMIGRTGDFGNTPNPQLHFQMRQGRAAVDPLKHLPPTA